MQTISISKLVLVVPALLVAYRISRAEETQTVQQKLEWKYKLTVINAEGGVVIQGVTLGLKKGLTAGGVASCTNDYDKGSITLDGVSKVPCTNPSAVSKICRFGIPGCSNPFAGVAGTNMPRGFVMGEKMYVTKIAVKDAVTFSLVSDSINNVIYHADLKLVFPKDTAPDFAKADQLAGEVFSVLAPDAQGGSTSAAPSSAPPASAALPAVQPPPPAASPAPQAPPLAPIPPPPPPPDQPAAPPPTVSGGMTIDQVVALLGPPQRVADLGSAKKIYSYSNLKITFVDGKVADIQ